MVGILLALEDLETGLLDLFQQLAVIDGVPYPPYPSSDA